MSVFIRFRVSGSDGRRIGEYSAFELDELKRNITKNVDDGVIAEEVLCVESINERGEVVGEARFWSSSHGFAAHGLHTEPEAVA